MPTIVPNFNFLAPLVTEIWRGPKIGAADHLRRALAGKLLHVVIVVTSGAHTTEWEDLTTCQDGTPRDLDPSNQELTIN